MRLPVVILALSALALAGCGGGGGGGVSSARTAHVFASDDLNAGYDHVWVTIERVVLHGSGGDVVAFDDPAGKVVDLRTLRDSTGARFLLLGTGAIPAGTYTGVEVTLRKDLVVFPTGATNGIDATFAGAGPTDATLSETFPAPATVAANGTLVVDFDLSHWVLDGNVVSAPEGFLKLGDRTGIEDNARHEADDFHGVVQNLIGTAPAQTFRIGSITVETSAATVVYDEAGTASPLVRNGERVEVRGGFDVASGHLLADVVKIENENGLEDRPKVEGDVTAFDANSGTITVSVREVEGFVPTSTSVTIALASNAKFFGDRGLALDRSSFFAALTVGTEIRARGSFDGTLNATEVKLSGGEGHHGGDGGDDHHGGHEAELTGGVLSVDAAGKTLVLAAKRWEGMNIAPNAHVTVAVTPTTEFQGFQSVDQFFAANLSQVQLEVEGSYDPENGVLTANRIKPEDD